MIIKILLGLIIFLLGIIFGVITLKIINKNCGFL